MHAPTIFHITHHKAGSQWVAEILKHAAPERVVLPKLRMAHFYDDPLRPGGVYLTVYVPKPDFDRVTVSLQGERRVFVVMRDLRDTLISRYFSVRYSHVTNTEYLRRARRVLNELSVEDGLLTLIGQGNPLTYPADFASFLPNMTDDCMNRLNPDEFAAYLSIWTWYHAFIQLSWLNAPDVLIVRYEEFVQDEQAVFANIIMHCQLEIEQKRLRQIVADNSFTTVTGRQRGQEDIMAHQRKGIVGDWRNHFSARVKDAFKRQFGEILITTGYEQDLNW